MKNLFLFATLLILQPAIIQAAPVGSGFNYQGELTDSGSPANGNYDILFKAFTLDTGGTEYAVVPAFSSVVVTNGLFSIDNVDFGDALYDGSEYWIEVSVRQTGTDTYFPLSPRQRLNATPYAVQADFLAANGANTGDYLKFNGSDWVGSALNIEPTPFTLTGGDLSYVDGRIGIGTHNPSAVLHVKGTTINPAIVEGGDNMYMLFRENEVSRGYIGSFQAQTNTNDEDFEIGTVNGSTGNMHIVTGSNNPRITVTADGKVGINNLIPEAELHVDGDVIITGNVKQNNESSGIMKYLVNAQCQNPSFLPPSGNPFIRRSYNGVNSGNIGITTGTNGSTCTINFPSDISERFWSVSPINSYYFNTHCALGSSNSLNCYTSDHVTGDPIPSLVPLDIMILVY